MNEIKEFTVNGKVIGTVTSNNSTVTKNNREPVKNNVSDNISALRIDLYDFTERPAEVIKPYWPIHVARYAWIPQTLGDQVWVMFDFNTEEKRKEWEESLPDEIKNCLDRDLIDLALGYGWNSRNANGFVVT